MRVFLCINYNRSKRQPDLTSVVDYIKFYLSIVSRIVYSLVQTNRYYYFYLRRHSPPKVNYSLWAELTIITLAVMSEG